MNLCPFDGVGLIVRNSEGKVLVLERKKIPLGLALPAGHRDIINGKSDAKEDWEVAARRELMEETGLVANKMRLIFDRVYKNPCSKGFDAHHWQVFEVTDWSGEPKLMEPDKHARVWWATTQEIKDWIRSGKATDPAWLNFILPELGF